MTQQFNLGDSASNDLGLIEVYKRYTREFSESPEPFHVFTLLATIACLVGRNRWIVQGEDTIYPNLYTLVVAPSSLFKKSSSIGLLKKWLLRLNAMNHFIGHIGSPEGLFAALSQNSGQAVAYYSELGVLLAQTGSRKYMGDALEMLNDLYDCPDHYAKRLSMELKRAQNVCLNLMAASQMDSLSRYVKEGDLLSGFLPRFTLVFSEDRKPHIVRRPPPNPKLRSRILEHLNKIRSACKDPQEMNPSEDAWELFEQWSSEKFAAGLSAPPQIQPFYGRLEGHVLKLGMLIELCRYPDSVSIGLKSMQDAIECAEFMLRGYRRLVLDELTFSLDEHKLKKVERVIRSAREISHRDVARATRYNSKVLQSILASLHEMEKIFTVKGKRGGKVYRWLDS